MFNNPELIATQTRSTPFSASGDFGFGGSVQQIANGVGDVLSPVEHGENLAGDGCVDFQLFGQRKRGLCLGDQSERLKVEVEFPGYGRKNIIAEYLELG